MNLLFVCTGNTCRSPLAAVIARAEAGRRGLDVSCCSAGTFAMAGQPAAALGVAVAGDRGLDLSTHRSRELALELVEWADDVLVMSPSHAAAAEDVVPGTRAGLVTEYLPAGHPGRGAAVPDPFGGDRETYEETAGLLELAIRGFFDDRFPETAGTGDPARKADR